jgi:hypothetical protein
MKFCIRDLLLVTVIVALAVGWGLEHRRYLAAVREIRATERLYGEERDRAEAEAASAKQSEAATISGYRRLLNSSGPAPNPPKE